MTSKQINILERRAQISGLWVVMLLNIIFRDIHEFLRPGFLEEILEKNATGGLVSEQLLLLSGIIIEIPIIMIFLTLLLQVKLNRKSNIIIATIMLVPILAFNLSADLDDLFFMLMEVAALLSIIWIAWKWPVEELKKGIVAH